MFLDGRKPASSMRGNVPRPDSRIPRAGSHPPVALRTHLVRRRFGRLRRLSRELAVSHAPTTVATVLVVDVVLLAGPFAAVNLFLPRIILSASSPVALYVSSAPNRAL